jgi:hypothetical protein
MLDFSGEDPSGGEESETVEDILTPQPATFARLARTSNDRKA